MISFEVKVEFFFLKAVSSLGAGRRCKWKLRQQGPNKQPGHHDFFRSESCILFFESRLLKISREKHVKKFRNATASYLKECPELEQKWVMFCPLISYDTHHGNSLANDLAL